MPQVGFGGSIVGVPLLAVFRGGSPMFGGVTYTVRGGVVVGLGRQLVRLGGSQVCVGGADPGFSLMLLGQLKIVLIHRFSI